MHRRTIASLFAILAGAGGSALAREVGEADVAVLGVEASMVGDGFQCKVRVVNRGDDDARATVLKILLPVEVDFRRWAIDEPNP